jgi:hypothetical protein
VQESAPQHSGARANLANIEVDDLAKARIADGRVVSDFDAGRGMAV